MTPCLASLNQPTVESILCMQVLLEETTPTTACSPAAARWTWGSPFGQWDKTQFVAASKVLEGWLHVVMSGGR